MAQSELRPLTPRLARKMWMTKSEWGRRRSLGQEKVPPEARGQTLDHPNHWDATPVDCAKPRSRELTTTSERHVKILFGSTTYKTALLNGLNGECARCMK